MATEREQRREVNGGDDDFISDSENPNQEEEVINLN